MRFIKTLLSEAKTDLKKFFGELKIFISPEALKFYLFCAYIAGAILVVVLTSEYLGSGPMQILPALVLYVLASFVSLWVWTLVSRVRKRIDTENKDTLNALRGNDW